jgi:hypothetical protein
MEKNKVGNIGMRQPGSPIRQCDINGFFLSKIKQIVMINTIENDYRTYCASWA